MSKQTSIEQLIDEYDGYVQALLRKLRASTIDGAVKKLLHASGVYIINDDIAVIKVEPDDGGYMVYVAMKSGITIMVEYNDDGRVYATW